MQTVSWCDGFMSLIDSNYAKCFQLAVIPFPASPGTQGLSRDTGVLCWSKAHPLPSPPVPAALGSGSTLCYSFCFSEVKILLTTPFP